jgi:hypothetical protein
MQFKIPSIRALILLLVGIPVGWLIIWLVLARVVGVQVSSASELSGLLAAIGGIMGAVFTVGGLVIALVAVLSQITLEDRAKSLLQDEFNKLMPTMVEQADKRVAGRIAFRDAQEAMRQYDWKTAQEQVQEATNQYPELSGVRSRLALAMSRAVEQHFLDQLRNVSEPMATLYELEANRQAGIAEQPRFVAPSKGETLIRLHQAHENHDNPNGQVSSAQALLSGIDGAYDNMLVAIREALAIDPMYLEYFRTPTHLAMLLYACDNNPDLIRQVGNLIDLTLPVPEKVVRERVDQFFATPQDQFLDWYVAERFLGQQPSRFLATVRFWTMDDEMRGKLGHATILSHGMNPYTVPAAQSEYLPVSELVDKLARQFIFICQTDL